MSKQGMKSELNVRVPMRDGVHLAADVYRPDAPGRFPVLLALSPYGKSTQRLMYPQPMPASTMGDACIEAGDTNLIVSRGYIHVIADTRGTGCSDGEYLSMYSEQESIDGYDLVEWLARQPWCDGQVGMIGISYYGSIQLVVASSRPPHLKAIAPLEATTDQYLACYHGGVLDAFYTELLTGRHSSLSWHGYTKGNFKSFTKGKLPTEDFERKLQHAITDPAVLQYNLLYSILDAPEKNPVFFDILLNPTSESKYWWSPDLSKIEIPVLCGVGQFPNCGPKFVRGPFMIWQGVKGPKKMLITPPGWLDRPFVQYHQEILRWYDYWFKNIDDGVMNEPPIRWFVTGDDEYHEEHEWPLARTQWTDFYLRSFGRLSVEPETWGEIEPDGYTQAPLLVTNKIETVSYMTGTMPRDMEVSGPITLYLCSSIDTDDAYIKATVYDRAPDGKERALTHGHLRMSHRKLDLEKSKPWQPFHDHTEAGRTPVVPGEVNEYAIELYPFMHVFLKGHVLRLELCSMDLPGAAFSYHVGSAKTVSHKFYRDSLYRSRLHLPVIPR